VVGLEDADLVLTVGDPDLGRTRAKVVGSSLLLDPVLVVITVVRLGTLGGIVLSVHRVVVLV
jgi:hypothetical protein